MADNCIPNIGPRERQRRLVGGFFFLAITLCVAVGLLWFQAPRLWRLIVFLPAWAAAIGFYQVKEKTCVALAARGLKNMDAGDEAISAADLDRVRAQSRRVHIRAVISGVVFAGLMFLL